MLNGFFFNTPVDTVYLGHQLAEIYKDGVYRSFFEGKKDLVVFDIGANVGMTSYYFSKFAKVVHSFEPSSEHYRVFTHMLKYNKIDNVIPYKKAVSYKDGIDTFHLSANKTMHSLRPSQDLATSGSEKVETVRLDTFFKQHEIQEVDFMKLDVEGSEMDIVCSESFQNIAEKIQILFIELHMWAGRNPNQMIEGLKMAKFSTIKHLPNDATLIVAQR